MGSGLPPGMSGGLGLLLPQQGSRPFIENVSKICQISCIVTVKLVVKHVLQKLWNAAEMKLSKGGFRSLFMSLQLLLLSVNFNFLFCQF